MQEIYAFSSQDIRSLRVWLWVVGLATVLLGAVGIALPFVMTLAVEFLLGGLLAALGLLQILRGAFAGAVESRLWTLLFGAVALTGGIVLLIYPLEGLLTLTIILATFFVMGGVAKLVGAWQMRPGSRRAAGLPRFRRWGWLALSGALSLAIGFLLLAGLPQTAAWALGVLLGIDLLFLGAAEIALAIGLTKAS